MSAKEALNSFEANARLRAEETLNAAQTANREVTVASQILEMVLEQEKSIANDAAARVLLREAAMKARARLVGA